MPLGLRFVVSCCVVAMLALGIAATLGPHSLRAAPSFDASSDWLVAQAGKRFSITGAVMSVDYVSNTVHMDANGVHRDIVITPTTAIEYRGEAGSISDIRHSSKITVSGSVRGGSWVANSVVIH